MCARKANKPPEYRYALDQCALYKLESKGRLASLLNCEIADLQRLARSTNNFKLFSVEKNDEWSSQKPRDVQEPKSELRRIHKRLFQLLQRVETPEYLHSATKQRSYISNAKTHIGQTRALKLDIRGFYPSTTKDAIYNFFRIDLQCGDDVATILSRLCTWNGILPTGSPISPHMAYFAHRQMFAELSDCAHARGLTFTVYVDDLVFSGQKVGLALVPIVEAIVHRSGLKLHPTKTRAFRAGAPKLITGVVVLNEGIRVPNSRVIKARALSRAYRCEIDSVNRLRLLEKLYGLVGEASQIDDRFKAKLNNIRPELQKLRGTLSPPNGRPKTTTKRTPRQAGAWRVLAKRRPKPRSSLNAALPWL